MRQIANPPEVDGPLRSAGHRHGSKGAQGVPGPMVAESPHDPNRAEAVRPDRRAAASGHLTVFQAGGEAE